MLNCRKLENAWRTVMASGDPPHTVWVTQVFALECAGQGVSVESVVRDMYGPSTKVVHDYLAYE